MPRILNGSERSKSRTRQARRWGEPTSPHACAYTSPHRRLANLEEAVMDRILELIHAIQFTSSQRKELLRRVALRLEQAERLRC